jgi:hypothetical protein
MLRDNLVGLIEPMQISAGDDPLAQSIQKQASDDRSLCLENPRPEGVESSLTENVTSPFQAEPKHINASSRGGIAGGTAAEKQVLSIEWPKIRVFPHPPIKSASSFKQSLL